MICLNCVSHLQAACRHSDWCVCEYCLLALSDAVPIHANNQPDHQGSTQRPSVCHQYHVARHRHLLLCPESRPPCWNCEYNPEQYTHTQFIHVQTLHMMMSGDTIRMQQSANVSVLWRSFSLRKRTRTRTFGTNSIEGVWSGKFLSGHLSLQA